MTGTVGGDQDLAQRLLAARRGGDYSPDWLTGAIDLTQALDLQLAVLAEETDRGRALGGWKVGLTSEATRSRLGVDERPFGFVLADRIFQRGGHTAAADIVEPSIETEMCFTIGRAITDPAITPDRVLDYVAAVSAGFELNERRPGATAPDFCAMVTDCLTNWGIVGGDEVAIADGDHQPVTAADLDATAITMWCDDDQVFEGVSRDHCDDHTVSLCHLVAKLARHGQVLQPGQHVITGAFARFPAKAGQRWRATYRIPAPDGDRTSTVEFAFT